MIYYLGKVKGKNAYEFIEAQVGRTMGTDFASITDLNKIFKVIFKKNPSADDINNFRSFQGLLKMMSNNLDNTTKSIVMDRFQEIISTEAISNDERQAIDQAIKDNLT